MGHLPIKLYTYSKCACAQFKWRTNNQMVQYTQISPVTCVFNVRQHCYIYRYFISYFNVSSVMYYTTTHYVRDLLNPLQDFLASTLFFFPSACFTLVGISVLLNLQFCSSALKRSWLLYICMSEALTLHIMSCVISCQGNWMSASSCLSGTYMCKNCVGTFKTNAKTMTQPIVSSVVLLWYWREKDTG